jgi:nucleotide-binding universal stress UspA family protein
MKILMATGGSAHSEVALHFGAHILHTSRASITPTVVTVARDNTGRPHAEAILALARSCQLLELSSPKLQTKIRIGHPAEEIIREAEEGNYDLIIVGERQHHGLKTRFLLGSTAIRVVEHAPCPVIIAKGKIGPLQRILLCDSGVESPSLLNRFSTQLAGLIKGEEEVTVLHVMSQISAGPSVIGPELQASAEELIQNHTPEGALLERDIEILQRLHFHPQPKVRHGLVVNEILQEAQSEDYNLVVIGAFRGQGWRRILLDDLAHQIITKVDRPVLVVR